MSPFVTSPAHAHARKARATIESALPIIREIPLKIDREGIALLVARAVKGLFINLDTTLDTPAHHDALVESRDALVEARALLLRGQEAHAKTNAPLAQALTLFAAAITTLTEAAREVADLQFAKRHELRGGAPDAALVALRPMRASVGVPQLHAPARSLLTPRFILDALVDLTTDKKERVPPPKPTTLAELRSAANSASNAIAPAVPKDEATAEKTLAVIPPLTTEREMIRRVARDCLEDIAILSTLREAIPTESWLDQAPFEERLLQNLDAFVSLGEVALLQITLFHAEAPAPDAARGFAVAFTLGCIEGTDAIEIAVATLKESAPEEHAGWIAGFALAPSPQIDVALAELGESPDPKLCALAITVLGARGALPIALAETLLARPDHDVTMSVVRALGFAGAQKRAIELLSAVAVNDTDDALFAAVIEARLRRGDGSARTLLREALASPHASPIRVGHAARLLASSGRASDVDCLIAAAARAPSIMIARALGRFGHVHAVPVLGSLLLAKEEGVAPAAAEAITRILGMTFSDHAAWSDFWKKAGARFASDKKLRGGQSFHARMTLLELTGKTSTTHEREDAALELLLLTGTISRFFPRDWVARQQSHLSDLAARLPKIDDGAWSYFGAATSK